MRGVKRQTWWFLAGLAAIGGILVWRCFYSVNTTDEAYYIGTTYRLWFGDGMLCDEWNPTQQMCSFWLLPFFALFRLILGSNDGMILAFRLLYIMFQLCISIYLYHKLKRLGAVCITAIFFYLLSTAFNINNLSYNTMANSSLVALLTTLAFMEEKNTKDCIFAGVFASIVVMGNPYAVFAYVLYGIACGIVTCICIKRGKKAPVVLTFGTIWKISLTALVVLAVFLVFTFQNATLERIIKNLPYIVGDQEHQQRWGVKISDYFRYFKKHYFYCVIGNALISAVVMIDRKRKERGYVYMLLSAVCTLPYLFYHGWVSDYVPINFVTVPICLMAVPAYLVSDKKAFRVFYIWYLPAMVYPFIVQITSNTGPLAVTAAFVTAGSASVLLLLLLAKEYFSASEMRKKAAAWVLSGIIGLQLVTMLVLRVFYVWADSGLAALDTKVERGPAKGLYTSQEQVAYYNELYDDLDSLQMKEDDGLLIIGSAPMLYLYADKEVASYSTWQVYTTETRLYRYYEVHDTEGKFPSVIYCVEADSSIYESIFVEKLLLPMGYQAEELAHGIAFYTER